MADVIISKAVDYNRKLDLIRMYSSYYSDDDFLYMFETQSLAEILEKYTYDVIRARLINTLNNTQERDIDVGDVVVINKPVLKDGVYQNIVGLVIGKHIVFDDYTSTKSPVYHTQYDVLIQTDVYLDGYAYAVRREIAQDLILKEAKVEGIEDILKLFNSIVIDRPV